MIHNENGNKCIEEVVFYGAPRNGTTLIIQILKQLARIVYSDHYGDLGMGNIMKMECY